MVKENKKYYWLKLKKDFFTNLKIKKLRRIAGGDTYTIIYQKLLLLSMENEGLIEYEGVEASLAEELSYIIDESVDNIVATLSFMGHSGLSEKKEEDDIFLPQILLLTGVETASTIRSRKSRSKMLHCNTDAAPMQQDCNDNATPLQHPATSSNTERREKILEIDIETKEKGKFNPEGFTEDEITEIKKWFTMMSKKGKPIYEQEMIDLIRAKAIDYRSKGESVIDMFKEATVKKWQDIYPSKGRQIIYPSNQESRRTNSKHDTDDSNAVDMTKEFMK